MSHNCSPPGFYLNLSIDILVHIFILFLILSLLFWAIISKISSDAITHEVNNNIDNAFSDYKKNMTEQELLNFKKHVKENYYLLSIMKKIYSRPDEVMIKNNNWLKVFNFTVIILLISILTVLLITLYVSSNTCIPIINILKENLILFIFIGIVEYLFFIKIGMKYVPVLPSKIIDSIVNRLNENFN